MQSYPESGKIPDLHAFKIPRNLKKSRVNDSIVLRKARNLLFFKKSFKQGVDKIGGMCYN